MSASSLSGRNVCCHLVSYGEYANGDRQTDGRTPDRYVTLSAIRGQHSNVRNVCTLQIEPLKEEANIVNQMYELIERYSVPAPPEDLVVFQVRTPPFSSTVVYSEELYGKVEKVHFTSTNERYDTIR